MMTQREEINFRFDLNDNKRTLHKVLRITIYISIFCLILSLSVAFIINQFSISASNDAKSYYFEKSPDIIAIFTGDRGRLEYALELLEIYPESKLLISGVYNKNTIHSLLNSKKIKVPGSLNENIASQVIELDYQAQNTIENVLMTLQYLRKEPSYKNILIISSDYHLLRIKVIIDTLNNNQQIESIHYHGVQSESNFFIRLMDTTLEGFKIFRSLLFSLFWLSEEVNQSN